MDRPIVEFRSYTSGSAGRFAESSDHAECRRLQRLHGKTYYFASRWLERPLRRRIHALYGFVRVPDQWVDETPGISKAQRARLLDDYRNQLIRSMDGVCPEHSVLRAFCDVIQDVEMPLDEPLQFLAAMELDLTVTRYATYKELRRYMRGSASAVGLMSAWMLDVRLEAPADGLAATDPMAAAAMDLGEAMQVTNFLRDVYEDALRGRVYLPQEDLDRFGVREKDIFAARFTPEFAEMIRWQIERARNLYAAADPAIDLLPAPARRPVRLARVLYARILDRIEKMDYNVFRQRARTTPPEKLAVLLRVLLQP